MEDTALADALARSETRFRLLVDQAPDGVVILKRGAIVFINRKAAHLLGVASIEAALGRAITEFLPPQDAALAAERIGAMFARGAEFPPSEYGVLADPARVVEIKSVICEWDGTPAVLAFARDVSERKALDRRLVEADRLAALGTLAAGIAHEINNPLTYAQLSTHGLARALASVALPADVAARLNEHLANVDHGIARIAAITRAMRTFARGDDGPIEPVELDAVITRALKMVENDLRHVAELVRETSPATVFANTSQLEQVLVNVLLNAIQAVDPKAGSKIRVTTTRTTGQRVTVELRDTGHGIPPAVRARVFEPFFTTRPVGAGTGLGLSMAKALVERFGGDISLDSAEGAGTTVRIQLREVPAERAAPPPAVDIAEDDPPRRRVLVVDDEALIADVLARTLSLHHDIETASSGPAALELLATSTYDVVLCDIMMPGMNGRELYDRIAAVHPGLERRIVFMSGGTFGSGLGRAFDGLPNQQIAKPFAIARVLEVIETTAVGD